MQIKTEFDSRDFAGAYRKFSDLVGESSWKKVVKCVDDEIKGNSFLEQYLKRQHRIAYSLNSIGMQKYRHGRISTGLSDSDDQYEASVLVAQVVDLANILDERNAKSLVGRVRGGLKNPMDMRALQFELQVATHLARLGFDIEFPNATGKSNVDIFAVRGGVELDFECKFVSINKGRSVQRREALELQNFFKKVVFPIFAEAKNGVILRVIFDDRPPKNYNDRLAVANEVKSALLTGGGRGKNFSISIFDFEVTSFPFESLRHGQDSALKFIEKFGVVNKEVAFYVNKAGAILAISIESARPDDMLEQVFSTVADAATRQLTGNRKGVICVKFEGISAGQLEEIGAEEGEPTALRIAVSRFLRSESSSNVALLSFVADAPVHDAGGGVVTRQGAVYSFPRLSEESSEIRGIFAYGKL